MLLLKYQPGPRSSWSSSPEHSSLQQPCPHHGQMLCSPGTPPVVCSHSASFITTSAFDPHPGPLGFWFPVLCNEDRPDVGFSQWVGGAHPEGVCKAQTLPCSRLRTPAHCSHGAPTAPLASTAFAVSGAWFLPAVSPSQPLLPPWYFLPAWLRNGGFSASFRSPTLSSP